MEKEKWKYKMILKISTNSIKTIERKVGDYITKGSGLGGCHLSCHFSALRFVKVTLRFENWEGYLQDNERRH